MSNTETAEVLGITTSGASSRYLRALKRLKDILGDFPGAFGGCARDRRGTHEPVP
jgi:hypothetical protein